MQREKWDEAEAQPDTDADVQMASPPSSSPLRPGAAGTGAAASVRSSPAKHILPDWTRTPLPVGAPPAPRPPAPPSLQAQSVAG